MPDASDTALLQEFVRHQSETAFAELVRRHLNLVYSVALRFTRNPTDAQDIAQAVFVILARKASGLRPSTILTGWLYETTRFTSLQWLRNQARRHRHEQEAHMQSESPESASPQPNAAEFWRQVEPLLEEGMARLSEKERTLLALRFFENRTGTEAASLLGIGEWAARKRSERALEKLRAYFSRRGVSSTAAALAATLSAHSIQIAPPVLIKSITTVALAKSATVTSSTVPLIKGALKIMALSKVKTTLVVAVAIVLLTSSLLVAVKEGLFHPIRDDYFLPNYRHFQNLPRGLFTLRPTHFTSPANGLDYSAEDSSPTGEHVTLFMGRNRTFEQLINKAYGGNPAYTLFPTVRPPGTFDYLCTILDSRAGEHLQTAIQKKFGYVASWQQRNTDAFVLKVKVPNLPGLRASDGKVNSENWRDGDTHLVFHNRSLWSLSAQLENAMNMPVLNQTDRSDALDFDLDCTRADLANRNWEKIYPALNRLGLELIPTNQPLQVLVVEPAK